MSDASQSNGAQVAHSEDSQAAKSIRVFVAIGFVFLAAAILVNHWTVGRLLGATGELRSFGNRATVWTFQAVCLSLGLIFLMRRERTPWRQMLMSAAATVVFLVIAEVGLRVFFALRGPHDRDFSDHLGWETSPHTTLDQEVPGFGRVHYTTGEHGFRRWGDPASPKPKVLVVGDSYTESIMISDGETYADLLARRRPDCEWFVYGCGGWGTLQELMLLRRHIDAIRPDLVILQMSANDLVNNSHALESISTDNNNQMTRPYWENGEVVRRFPENGSYGPVYNLLRSSYLLRIARVNVQALQRRGAVSPEDRMTAKDPLIADATRTTVDLLRQWRTACGPAAAVAFCADPAPPYWSPARVCRKADLRFIEGVGDAVAAAKKRGEQVDGSPIDAHWNARGHAIAADHLADRLEAERLLPKR